MTDYTIMVRNLPETCTEKDLIDHFSGLYALNRIDWRERSPLPGTKPVDTSVHAEVVGTWVADCVVFYAIGRLLSSFKKHQALLGDHHIHLPSQHIPSLLVPSLLCTLLHTLSYSYLTNVVTFPSLTTPHPLPTPSPFSPLLTPPLLTAPFTRFYTDAFHQAEAAYLMYSEGTQHIKGALSLLTCYLLTYIYPLLSILPPSTMCPTMVMS